jgi:hypothetical protein
VIFEQTGTRQILKLDGCEALGLLKFKGKSEATSKICFRVADGTVTAYARNGVGAELFIRGNALSSEGYECAIDASALERLKFVASDTLTITCGSKAKLALTHINESAPDAELAIHKHFSSQLKISETAWVIPERPEYGAGDCPFSLDLDWSLYGMIGKVINYAGSLRVRQYTPREDGGPLYVEFGQERSYGDARWFSTFKPWVEDDEVLSDEGRQVELANTPIPIDDNDAEDAG